MGALFYQLYINHGIISFIASKGKQRDASCIGKCRYPVKFRYDGIILVDHEIREHLDCFQTYFFGGKVGGGGEGFIMLSSSYVNMDRIYCLIYIHLFIRTVHVSFYIR